MHPNSRKLYTCMCCRYKSENLLYIIKDASWNNIWNIWFFFHDSWSSFFEWTKKLNAPFWFFFFFNLIGVIIFFRGFQVNFSLFKWKEESIIIFWYFEEVIAKIDKLEGMVERWVSIEWVLHIKPFKKSAYWLASCSR